MTFLPRCLLIVLVLCGQHYSQARADLVIINANVRTMTADGRTARAVAVAGNKITAVGTDREILAMAGPATEVIDAGGRLVLPGFNDSHVHFTAIGNIFSSADLSGVRSPEEMRAKIAEFARFLPAGRWILGRGWDNGKWANSELPTKELIDQTTPNNPVLVYNADGTTALANSLALTKGGLNRLSRTRSEGDVERDQNGEPTGIIRGAVIRRVSAAIPQPHVQQWPDLIETASNYAASLGVTSVLDVHSDELSDIYREIDTRGKLKTRVYDCAPLSSWRKLEKAGMRAAAGDAMVRTGCLKHFVDGDSAAADELAAEIAGADRAGLQVMIHAIGPDAIDEILTVFERVTKQNGPRDRRFRVEHAHNARVGDLPRFARSKVIASMQPWLFYRPARRDTAFRSLLDAGGRLAFGSDASMTDLNPRFGVSAAVESSLTVEQAVRAYTIDAAFAEFQENVKGTIETGKLADIVMLSDDIFKIAPAKIRDSKVVLTIVNGKVVYKSR
mgnify:CR=1 FL=1